MAVEVDSVCVLHYDPQLNLVLVKFCLKSQSANPAHQTPVATKNAVYSLGLV